VRAERHKIIVSGRSYGLSDLSTIFAGYLGKKSVEAERVRIPTKAATYSNLIAATIPI
jgi:hypothetical protein